MALMDGNHWTQLLTEEEQEHWLALKEWLTDEQLDECMADADRWKIGPWGRVVDDDDADLESWLALDRDYDFEHHIQDNLLLNDRLQLDELIDCSRESEESSESSGRCCWGLKLTLFFLWRNILLLNDILGGIQAQFSVNIVIWYVYRKYALTTNNSGFGQ